MDNFDETPLITEASEGGRFSFSIPIPRLVPTEAWGDPSSQSRKDIERIFASITRQPDIKARIAHVNSFLDPKEAVKKAPGGKVNTVLNMLQIIEALQSTLNDYNESSAGFVFEGFIYQRIDEQKIKLLKSFFEYTLIFWVIYYVLF